MSLKYFFALFIFLLARSLYATDQNYLDSVQNKLNSANDARDKLKCLYILSYEYGYIEPSRGIDYGWKMFRLAKDENDLESQLNAYNGIANAYETLSDYDSALYYHSKTLEIAKEMRSWSHIGLALGNTGICYKELGNYRKALQLYLMQLNITEGQEWYNPRIHFHIGEIYIRLGNFAQAEYHSLRGIQKCIEFKHDYIIHNMYINLARCYMHEGKIDSAIVILSEKRDALKQNTDLVSIGQCLNALGEAYLLKKDYVSALTSFEEELKFHEQSKNENGKCLAHLNIAYSSSHLGDEHFSNVRKHLQLAESGIPAIRRNRDVLKSSYLKLSECNEQIHDVNKALEYYKLYTSLSNELLDEEKARQVNELQTRYETEKKNQRIQAQELKLTQQAVILERQKFQIILTIAIFFLASISILFAYNRYRAKQRAAMNAEIQKQERLREIAIKEKEYQERIRIAKDLHDELGSGISKIALISEYSKQHIETEHPVHENIKTISRTSQGLIENMRDLVWALNSGNITFDNLIARMREYGSEFFDELPIHFHFSAEGKISSEIISRDAHRNIFMTYKESLNNVAKHSEAITVSILVNVSNTEFNLVVTDDGRGVDPEKSVKGNGIYNMRKRTESMGGEFKFFSNPEAGSTIRITLQLDKILEEIT